MKDLGLDRRARPAPDPTGYLARQYGSGKGGNGETAGQTATKPALAGLVGPVGAVTNPSVSDSKSSLEIVTITDDHPEEIDSAIATLAQRGLSHASPREASP